MRLPALAAALAFAAAPAFADAPKPAAPAAATAAPKENPDFVKGELTNLGATKLKAGDTRFGVRAGVSKIGQVYYIAGSLEFDLRLDKFELGLAAPVQIPLWDPAKGLGGLLPEGIVLRKEDYATPRNFARMIRFLSYGKKEDPLFVNLGTETSTTIGHGAAVRRFVSNVDVNTAKLSAEVDAYGKYGGGELFVGDLLDPAAMVGGIAFLKPFGASENILLQRLSFGVTYAADLAAPFVLKRGPNNRQCITAAPGETVPEGECPIGDRNSVPLALETKPAQIVGISIETKVVKTETTDVKPYLELSKLVGGGAGASVGGLGRFTFGTNIKHALRAIGELRAFQGNYLPGYFDTFYSIQRYQYFQNPSGKGDPTLDVPKLADVLGRESSLKMGYYAEFQYAMIDWFAVTLAWEDSNAKGGRNLVVHGEVPANETLRFFVSAHRRGVEGGLFDIGRDPVTRQLSADNTLLIAGARLRILPILYVNARAFRMWQMDPLPQGFQNVDGFQLDVELGYEFKRGEDDK